MTSASPPAIEARGIRKSFRGNTVVDDVSFSVRSGVITGFLGPNGAGKTTTLRCMLGLVRPDSGQGLFHGTPYTSLNRPVEEVGAVLEATNAHPGRSARQHLLIMCESAGLPGKRADEVLAEVGLSEARNRRVGAFSLGMRQRLALAGALLGEPPILILDEPANGLDPAGIEWLRRFLLGQAEEKGVAVLVSSHILAEVEQTVDDVVIIAGGRLVRQASLSELSEGQGSLHEVFLELTSASEAPLAAGGAR